MFFVAAQDGLNAVKFNCKGTFQSGSMMFSAGSSYVNQLLGWFESADGILWQGVGQFSTQATWCNTGPDFGSLTVSGTERYRMECTGCHDSGSYTVTVPLPTDHPIEWWAFAWGHSVEPREFELSSDAIIKCEE